MQCPEVIEEHFTIDRMAERMIELLNRTQELSRVSSRPIVGKGLGLGCVTLAIALRGLSSPPIVAGPGTVCRQNWQNFLDIERTNRVNDTKDTNGY